MDNLIIGFFISFVFSFIAIAKLKTEEEYKHISLYDKKNIKIYLINAILGSLGFYIVGISVIDKLGRYINFMIILYLAMSSSTDMFDMIVPDSFHVGFTVLILLARILNRDSLKFYFISAVLCFIFLFIVFLFSNNKLGGADVKVFLPIGLTIGMIQSIDALIIALLLACLISIIVGISRFMKGVELKDWRFAFIPYIYMGVIISYQISLYSLLNG